MNAARFTKRRSLALAGLTSLGGICFTDDVPIYEYECTKCGHRFELIQKLSDSPRRKCEKCQGKAERLVSSPAIQFKGTGWYVTDYARKGSGGGDKEAPSKSDSSEKTSKKKSSGKSEKKEKTGATSS